MTRTAYLGKDQHMFKYWLVGGDVVYREWPESGGTSNVFCSLGEWNAGEKDVLGRKADSRYVYST